MSRFLAWTQISHEISGPKWTRIGVVIKLNCKNEVSSDTNRKNLRLDCWWIINSVSCFRLFISKTITYLVTFLDLAIEDRFFKVTLQSLILPYFETHCILSSYNCDNLNYFLMFFYTYLFRQAQCYSSNQKLRILVTEMIDLLIDLNLAKIIFTHHFPTLA